jgi:deoxycytidylate deaminase
MTRPLRIARKAARRSVHPQHHMAAVVVRGGAVVSVGVNGAPGGPHAETRALRPHRDYSGCDIYVVRLAGRRTSRPCPSCLKRILQAGIRRVTFTDEYGLEQTIQTILLDSSKASW